MNRILFERIKLPAEISNQDAALHYVYLPSSIKDQPWAKAPISVAVHLRRIAFLVTERMLEPLGDEGFAAYARTFPGGYCFLEIPLLPFRQAEAEKALIGLQKENDNFSHIHIALTASEYLSERLYKSGFSHLDSDDRDQYEHREKSRFERRRVFLDFLFEFFHTASFRGHPHYREIAASLRANPIIAAILAKNECYYWLRTLDDKIAEQDTPEEKKFTEQKFKTAYREWENLLLEDAHQVVDTDKKWLKNPEEELSQLQKALKRNPIIFDFLQRADDAATARSKKSKWHFKRLDYWDGFISLFPRPNNGKIAVGSAVLALSLAIALLLWGKLEIAYYQNGIWTLLGLVAVLVVLGLISRFRRNRTPIDTSTIIEITKLPLVIGSSAVWVFIYTSNRFWNLDLTVSYSKIFLLLIGLLIAYFFLKNQINSYLKGHERYTVEGIKRAFIGIFIACLFSALTGLVLSTKFTDHALTHDNFLTDYFAEMSEDSLRRRLHEFDAESDSLVTAFYISHEPQAALLTDTISVDDDSTGIVSIVVRQSPPTGKVTDKQLLEKVLPFLKLPGRNAKVLLSIPLWSDQKIYLRFLPQMVLYYTFIAAAIGILVELGYKRFKGSGVEL